jgi:stearoyl-CoA desaturase (Delta-9 desaturase)
MKIRVISKIIDWWRSDYTAPQEGSEVKKGIDWVGSIPFLLVHVMSFGVIWVGWNLFAIYFALIFYLIRMFGITAFYHRYFAHRAFETNRFFAFLFAFLGCSAMQRGPLWWAAIHRHHHLYADTDKDIHSPVIQGFIWSHIGWILAYANKRTRVEYLKDWLKYPEIVFLDRFALAVPVVAGFSILGIGHLLYLFAPGLGTNGLQLAIWGFFVSTVFCSHATFSINSIDHMYGSRRYEMQNTSRNNLLMAILTLGEGWHNNHHHYPATAHAGFYWWEIDITYYLLELLSWFGIVKHLRLLPDHIRDKDRIGNKVRTATDKSGAQPM